MWSSKEPNSPLERILSSSFRSRVLAFCSKPPGMKMVSAAKPPKSPTSSHAILSPPLSRSKPLSGPITWTRIFLLYKGLQLRDARSRYPWRLLALAAIVCSFLSMTHSALTAIWRTVPAAKILMPGAHLYQRYETMFYNDSDFAYIPESSMMITTTAKAASTSFWTWLHRGVTGLPSFDRCNNTYIQNFAAPCWLGKVVHPFNMTDSERWTMVNRPETLRVTITRDPYERLISAWKSKVACDSDDFGTDVADRDKIVPILLRQANIQKDVTCLSLTNFAIVLEKLRKMSQMGTFDIHDLNKHFRPQERYFKDIIYDIVLDLQDLSNKTRLAPIVKRLKYGYLLTELPKTVHVSRSSFLITTEKTAASLHKFAMLTEPSAD